MKTTLALLLFCTAAFAEIQQATITGTAYQETGATVFPELGAAFPFRLTYQFDDSPNVFDWNPSANVGDYFYPDLPASLQFGDLYAETLGTRLTVSNDGLNEGFIFWSLDPFVFHGFEAAQYGLYIQFNAGSVDIIPSTLPEAVEAYDIHASDSDFERFYLINSRYGVPGASNPVRFLSDASGGVATLEINQVPEPETWALLLCAIALLSTRGGFGKRSRP